MKDAGRCSTQMAQCRYLLMLIQRSFHWLLTMLVFIANEKKSTAHSQHSAPFVDCLMDFFPHKCKQFHKSPCANTSFCVLKKYTLKSVSMSGRLHDNSRNNRLTVLKFFTQNCHINISVEFEDEPNPLRIFWFSIGNTLIFYRFFDGKWSSSDFFENYRIECSFSRWFRIWT